VALADIGATGLTDPLANVLSTMAAITGKRMDRSVWIEMVSALWVGAVVAVAVDDFLATTLAFVGRPGFNCEARL
jgi:hypothetical protein